MDFHTHQTHLLLCLPPHPLMHTHMPYRMRLNFIHNSPAYTCITSATRSHPAVAIKASWKEDPHITHHVPFTHTHMHPLSADHAYTACTVCFQRSAANFSPRGSVISACHKSLLIRSNRFSSIGIKCVFFITKKLAFLATRCFIPHIWFNGG